MLSKAESLRRYFLTLPASDREDVLVVRDEPAIAIVRSMQDMQAAHGAAAASVFSFAGAAQRRSLKSYGQWVTVPLCDKPVALGHSPTAAQLTRAVCPPDVVAAQRVVEASARLEAKLHVECNTTLHVPCGDFEDDKEAGRFVVDLLALAPLVSGKDANKPQHSCVYFTVASYTASLLLQALICSYNQAAARHRAASDVQIPRLAAFLTAGVGKSRVVSGLLEQVKRLAVVVAGKAAAERAMCDVRCAKAILSAVQLGRLPTSALREYHRVKVQSHAANSGLLELADASWALVRERVAPAPGLEAWTDTCGPRGKAAHAHIAWTTVLGMMCSAPLVHARVHRTLFEGAWSEASVQGVRAVVEQLEGKARKTSLRKSKELGLSMEDGRFGSGRSMFNTYADFETREVEEEEDGLVVRRDDEWSQMGRIREAQRSIDAKLGMQALPGDEMSGGINGSIFFSMAALEKKLEDKIPKAVYPDMARAKRAAPDAAPTAQAEPCARLIKADATSPCWTGAGWTPGARGMGEAEAEAEGEGKASNAPMSFLDAVRKKQAAGQAAAPTPTANKGGCGKTAPMPQQRADACQPPAASEGAQKAASQEAQDWPAMQGHAHRWPQGNKTAEAPSAWGQAKVWSVGAGWSAAEAAQAASGVVFAQQPPPSHACAESTVPPSAHRDDDTAQLAERGSAGRLGATGGARNQVAGAKAWGGNTVWAQQTRVRYNPLRPQHLWLPLSNESRCATAKLLHSEIEDFVCKVEATEASRRHRDEIVEQVREAVQACWPEASVEVYGSFSTDLFLPHSDVDLLVLKAQASKGKSALKVLSERLRDMDCCRYIKAIDKASVPVVKLTADVTKLSSHTSSLTEQAELGKQEEEERSCIAVDVTLDCHIGDAPVRLRDFVRAQLGRFPIIRPLVLVLKHFLFQQGLNDAYKGGLSSHSVILLLIFYFNIPEVAAAYEAGKEAGNPGYIEEHYWYGEWLLRVMQWLSEFPFNDVGIAVDPMSYVPLTHYGFGMLTTGECDPELPDVDAQTGKPAPKPNVLHIEDPFNSGNIAKGCFEWWLVRRTLEGAYRILGNHQGAPPLARIFGGVPQRRSPLASIFDRQDVAASVDEVIKAQAAKRHAVLASRPPPSV